MEQIKPCDHATRCVSCKECCKVTITLDYYYFENIVQYMESAIYLYKQKRSLNEKLSTECLNQLVKNSKRHPEDKKQ